MNKTIPVKWIGVDKTSGRGLWIVTSEFSFCGHTIPEGFVTDGGSIPSMFEWLIRPTGAVFAGAIAHDVLYTTHEVSRYKADVEMYKMFRMCGLSKFASMCAFLAVRAFGGGKNSWDSDGPSVNTAEFKAWDKLELK